MKRRINLWSSLDWFTILIFLGMIFFGWINIYAAVYNEEASGIFDISQRYGKQFLWIVAAIILAFFVIITDSRFYIFFSYIIYVLVIASLLLVLLVGKEVNGARSWFAIGAFSLQPSEFAKFATALALAKYLSGQASDLTSFRSLALSAAIIFAPAALILFQPDMGSMIVFFSLVLVLYREGLSPWLFITGILAAILFIATLLAEHNHNVMIAIILIAAVVHLIAERDPLLTLKGIASAGGIILIIWLVSGAVLPEIEPAVIIMAGMVISSVAWAYYIFRHKARNLLILMTFLAGSLMFIFIVDFAFNNILKPHQQTRISDVLGAESDPYGTGYSLNQSIISIGSGGFSGKGFLNGTQTRFKFVPEQSTDFIFCTVGEEWGFLGSSFVIILFMVLLYRLIVLAERQRSSFTRIYGYGVVSILLFHFLINIGMTIGLVPVIGIPLPFFSYGGSSLWGFTLLLFIFLRLDASRNEYLV
ncbi:MAG: rod shape-determining protein RodA [Bacteroidales bacterium]|nr:rod shape-determining protein RodA [Bacteroidales bacterium]